MTGTAPHAALPAISWEDLANAVAMCATAQWDPINHPAWKETLDRFVALNDAGPEGHGEGAPAAPAEPPLPPGIFGYVTLPRMARYDGWITKGIWDGVPTIRVSDWDGRVIAEISPNAYREIIQQPTPLRRPDPEPLAALPAGQGDPWADDRYDGGGDDREPADAFAGRMDPEAPF